MGFKTAAEAVTAPNQRQHKWESMSDGAMDGNKCDVDVEDFKSSQQQFGDNSNKKKRQLKITAKGGV